MFRRMLARPISYNSLCSQVAQSTSSPSLSNWTKEALVSSRAKFLKDPRFLSNDNRTFTVFFENAYKSHVFSFNLSLSLLIHVRISNRGKKCCRPRNREQTYYPSIEIASSSFLFSLENSSKLLRFERICDRYIFSDLFSIHEYPSSADRNSRDRVPDSARSTRYLSSSRQIFVGRKLKVCSKARPLSLSPMARYAPGG